MIPAASSHAKLACWRSSESAGDSAEGTYLRTHLDGRPFVVNNRQVRMDSLWVFPKFKLENGQTVEGPREFWGVFLVECIRDHS